MACGDRRKKQALIGKLLMPFVKSSFLGEKPFSKNGPTDPDLIVADDRDFVAERTRLMAMVDRFCKGGPDAAGQYVHSFFGKLTGDEWGRLMHKHIDHHLRQFGA